MDSETERSASNASRCSERESSRKPRKLAAVMRRIWACTWRTDALRAARSFLVGGTACSGESTEFFISLRSGFHCSGVQAGRRGASLVGLGWVGVLYKYPVVTVNTPTNAAFLPVGISQ